MSLQKDVLQKDGTAKKQNTSSVLCYLWPGRYQVNASELKGEKHKQMHQGNRHSTKHLAKAGSARFPRWGVSQPWLFQFQRLEWRGGFTRANSLECAVRCETREEDAAGRAAAAVGGPPGGSAFLLTTLGRGRVTRLAAQNAKKWKMSTFHEIHEISRNLVKFS